MNLPVKPILFAIIIIAATTSTAYLLTLLDQIVHGTLYEYNLTFNLAWANPYWNLLRLVQVLLGVIGISTAVYTLFTLRTYIQTKNPTERIISSPKPVIRTPGTTQTKQKPETTPIASSTISPIASPPATVHAPSPAPLASPPPVPAPTPAPVFLPPSAPSGYIRCLHCGKVFTQPLRMLDFQGDRPRIISICPFCNEIISSAPRQEEIEQNKRSLFKSKKGDQAAKTFVSQATS